MAAKSKLILHKVVEDKGGGGGEFFYPSLLVSYPRTRGFPFQLTRSDIKFYILIFQMPPTLNECILSCCLVYNNLCEGLAKGGGGGGGWGGGLGEGSKVSNCK